jgi:cobalt-zinc-cadmium resistance protein CzcA
VVVKVFGDDLLTLREIAERVGEALKDIPGTGDLRVQRVLGLPMLEAKVDWANLSRVGLSAADVLDAIEAVKVGTPVGKIFEGPRRFDMVVRLQPARESEEGFSSILVGAEERRLVPLAQVSTVRRTEGPAVINREGLRRRVVVEVNVRGRDLVSYVQEAKARVDKAVTLPERYKIVWGGQFENFSRAATRLGLVVPIALAIVFGMLFFTFREARLALAVFITVPLALIGGVVGLTLRGLPFSIPAGVGFIALSGVAVLNGVVMTSDFIRRLEEMDFDAALRASARSTLRPVLMTAGVAAIGFIPMAISTMPGAEVQRPLATVVIGGMISATILTLLVLPLVLRVVTRPR